MVVGDGVLVGQYRPRGVVVGGPGVPHGDRDVVEVSGVEGRAGEVVADRLQQHLVPAARHGVLGLGHRGSGRQREPGADREQSAIPAQASEHDPADYRFVAPGGYRMAASGGVNAGGGRGA